MKRGLATEVEGGTPSRRARRRLIHRVKQNSPKMNVAKQKLEQDFNSSSQEGLVPVIPAKTIFPPSEAEPAAGAEDFPHQEYHIAISDLPPSKDEGMQKDFRDASVTVSPECHRTTPPARSVPQAATRETSRPSDEASALVFGPLNLPDKPLSEVAQGADSSKNFPIDPSRPIVNIPDDLMDESKYPSPTIPAKQHSSQANDVPQVVEEIKNTKSNLVVQDQSPDAVVSQLDQHQSWLTTQVPPTMVPDSEISDEAYAESTLTSYVTSLASEISRGMLENERVYPAYGQHSYGMPVDEDEMDRMDLQHRKYELVLNNRHFLAPIGPNPQNILDLGTGTGIWALDVADMYPSASVIGVDIASIQPKWVATNCQFEIDDIEATWTYKMESFDFIHFRDPLYCIRDWPRLMQQCFDHLKPGGWCELACIYPVVKCDDGTMPEDSGFKVICDKFMEASAIIGTPTDSPIRFAKYLRDAGFINVSENIFKIPSSPWPKDRRYKQIGLLEMTNVVEGAAAFGLRAFSQAFGWTKERTELAMVDFKRDVKNRAYHQYCEYYVVYGQKPPHIEDDHDS